MHKLTLLAAASFAAMAVPASATIQISDKQQVSNGQTIQFPVQPDGTSVTGLTNKTSTSVTFSTLTGQTLTTPSKGQARIEAVGDDGQIPLDSMLIQLTDMASFGYIEFNLFGGNITDSTSVTINALDQFGNPFQIVHSLGNGENFFSAIGLDGESIKSIWFNTQPGGVNDLRQVRINTATNLVPDVPEPATWAMMLFGFGAAGIAMRRSRRKAPLAQVA